MGGKAKGKQRQDKFYHLAKEQGYRSRASFKLLQLDAKYRFLPSSRSILDLCAAPGGWLQVAVKHAPVGSFILGVDLFPIRPVRGAHSIVQDITTSKCRSEIKKLMDQNGCSAFNCVLHDGSPNVGANWSKDATSQSALVVDSIRLATMFLSQKGTFVTKVFRSQDYNAIIYCLKQLFDKVEVTKPVASRNTSAEIYVIGLKYKAPAKIDPRLLDVRHLFQGGVDPPKVLDVLRGTKQKRNREGYEDGVTLLWKVVPVSNFIWSDNPAVFLGSVNQLSFEDSACLPIKEHELTTEEIKSFCGDLTRLDKQSFKALIKWRVKMRNALASTNVASKASENAKDDVASGDKVEVDEDEKLLNEMEELTNALERKKKRQKKLLAKRRDKDKIRKATGMQIDATQDSYYDRDLFSLATIKGKKDLEVIDSTELDEENDNIKVSDSEEETYAEEPHGDAPSDIDSDEEQRRYDEQVEEMIDRAYEQYMSKKGSVTNERKRVKLARSNGQAELFEGDDGQEIMPDEDMNRDRKNDEKNPLMQPLYEEEEPTQEQIMEQWFSQDVFAEAAQEGMLLEKSESEEEKEEAEVKTIAKSSKKASKQNSTTTTSKTPISEEEDFEVVPSEPIKSAKDSSSDDDSSDDEDDDDIDDDAKAEILAYAKKMLRKKQREEILDDAYNRYVFDDDEAVLPTWFVEEENRHNKPMKPITKDEVQAMKSQFREIDARPAKKVAQAKARKKRVAMKQLDKARQKSNSIAEQTDISESSKKKMIDQLYKKAAPKRPKKELVVAKKGVQVRPGKGTKLVDRRMKKDMRAKGSGRPGKNGKVPKGKGKGSGPKKGRGFNAGGAKGGGRKGGKMNNRD